MAVCDGSLIFNPKLGACDYPQNVECKCKGTCFGDPKINGPCYGKFCGVTPAPPPHCGDCLAPGIIDPNPPCFGDNCPTCTEAPTTPPCVTETSSTSTTPTPTTSTTPRTTTTPTPPTCTTPTPKPPQCCCCCCPTNCCNNGCNTGCNTGCNNNGYYREANEIDGDEESSDYFINKSVGENINILDMLLKPKNENNTQ